MSLPELIVILKPGPVSPGFFHLSASPATDMPPPECEFTVEWFLNSKRIDRFLNRHLRNWSPWRIQRMVQSGCVWVNDAPATIDYRVRPNDRVRIRLVSPPDRSPVPQPIPVEVLHEDPWLIAVNKPSGQMAHPGGEFLGRTLINALQHYLDQQTPQPGMVRPGIVHRIDRQTSGVMICPKEHVTHRKLTQQFEQHEVEKSYVAIVCGDLPDDEGSIDLAIGTVPNPNCTLMCAKPIAVDKKSACTRYRVIERFGTHTFVEAMPLSGRHHQIRIHFAEFGFPLLADQYYATGGLIKDGTPIDPEADPDSFAGRRQVEEPYYEPELPLRRHALHAAKITFEHPVFELPMQIEAPLPGDLTETLDALQTRGS